MHVAKKTPDCVRTLQSSEVTIRSFISHRPSLSISPSHHTANSSVLLIFEICPCRAQKRSTDTFRSHCPSETAVHCQLLCKMNHIANSDEAKAQTEAPLPIYRRPKDDKEAASKPQHGMVPKDHPPSTTGSMPPDNVCFVSLR